MPRKRINIEIDVTGFSINDIVNMDYDFIRQLSRRELAKLTSRLVSATNKRIRRLQKSEIGSHSFALHNLLRRTGGEQLSVKGKTQGQVQNVFSIAKNFLTSKTSTVRGFKRVLKNMKTTIESKTGLPISNIDIAKLFNTLHRGQELGLIDPPGTQGSERAVGMITELMERNPNKTVDDLIDDLNNWYDNMETQMFEQDTDDYDTEIDDFDNIR